MRAALLLTLLTACWSSASSTSNRSAAEAPPGHVGLMKPIQIDSLSLTPILLPDTPNGDPNFLVLDEGMATDIVTITEVPGGTVNELVIVNRSNRDLFLLAGEVIIGGKQDRIIGRNTVIPADSDQRVPVFCVEHGRWDSGPVGFRSANALAHGRLRGQASYADQQEVWAEVANKNSLRGVTNSTDTYRDIASQQSSGLVAAQRAQIAAALAQLPADARARMIGYAVAINGTVVTVDMFGSPTLFRKLENKLLQSYLTEAIDVPARPDAAPPSWQSVEDFMANADHEAEQRSYETERATTSIQSGTSANRANVYVGGENVYKNYQSR